MMRCPHAAIACSTRNTSAADANVTGLAMRESISSVGGGRLPVRPRLGTHFFGRNLKKKKKKKKMVRYEKKKKKEKKSGRGRASDSDSESDSDTRWGPL